MAITEKASPSIHKWQIMPLWIFCVTLPFVYSSAGVDPSILPRQVAASFLILILGCLVFITQQKSTFRVGVIPLFLILLWFVYGFSYFQATNQIEATYIILKIGIFVCVGWVVYALMKYKMVTLEPLSLMVTITGIITTLLSVGNMMALHNKGVNVFEGANMYKVNATFGHKNLLSSFLFLCLPMFGVQVAVTTNKAWRVTLYSFGIVLIGILVLLQTRAVLLAISVCGLAVLFLLIFGLAKHLSSLQKRIGILIASGSILLLFSCLYIYRDKLSLLTRTESFFERKNLWDNTLQMISEHPIAGVGAANWQIQMPKYSMQKFYEANYTISEGLTNFQRPHNDFLWVWAETGVIGFLTYSLIFMFSLVYAFQLFRKEESLSLKIGYVMLFVQVLGFMVISSVDFPWERIEHPVVLMMTIGFLAATHDAGQQWQGLKTNRWMWLIPILLSLYSIFVCAQRWKSELQLRKMYKAHAAGNWQRLVVEGTKAQTPYFNMDYYSIPLQWYVGVGYFMQDNLGEAKKRFEEAYQLHPYQVHVLNNYGACFEKEGNHTKAIELLEQSHRLSPTFSDGIINLSGAYFNAGRLDDAYNTITKFRYDEQNERFKQFALAIIKVKFEDIIAKEKTTPFATYLKQIVSDDKRILFEYQKSEEHQTNLLVWLQKQSIRHRIQ